MVNALLAKVFGQRFQPAKTGRTPLAALAEQAGKFALCRKTGDKFVPSDGAQLVIIRRRRWVRNAEGLVIGFVHGEWLYRRMVKNL